MYVESTNTSSEPNLPHVVSYLPTTYLTLLLPPDLRELLLLDYISLTQQLFGHADLALLCLPFRFTGRQ